MSDTIFDKIVSGEIPSWKVWESETHTAFLTPYSARVGTTVVIPKTNIGDSLFELASADYSALMDAAKEVAEKLKKGLNVERVAMVVEGLEVPYVHIRLYPVGSDYVHYPDSGKIDDEEMTKIQKQITA